MAAPDHYPNTFDCEETPVLREAFARAWQVLKSIDIANDPDVGIIRTRLASALIKIASDGVFDADLMAKAAIDKMRIDDSIAPVSLRRSA
jgi:hypothetical protein